MQITSSFLISRLLNEKQSEKGPSQQTLAEYKQIVRSQNDLASLSHANFLTANELVQKNLLSEAAQLGIQMISRLPDDPQTRNDFYYLIHSIHEKLVKLGVEDSTNPEIAKAYENLIELGHVGIETHYIVLQHYLLVRDIQKAKILLKNIMSALPNYAGLKELEEQFKTLSKEII